MEFKKLNIDSDENWFRRNIWTAHGKKTIIFIFLGALGGFLLYLVQEDTQLMTMTWNEVFPNLAIGAFFGFFITNSPCARGRC